MKSLFFGLPLLLALTAGSYASSGAERVALRGHIPAAFQTASKLERLPSDTPLRLSLAVQLDTAALSHAIEELYGPGSTAKKTFLSSAEFAARFGLAGKRQALKDFARDNGFALTEDDPNSMVVKVSGNAGQVENAFAVQLFQYRTSDGKMFRGHDGEPTVPKSLAPHLGAVLGLSNFPLPAPVRPAAGSTSSDIPKSTQLFPASASPPSTITPKYGNGTAPCPVVMQLIPDSDPPQYQPLYTLCPPLLKQVYELDSTPLNGSGQMIAVFSLTGFNPNYVTAFANAYGLGTLVGAVGVDGADPTAIYAGFSDLEATFDVEMALALAPQANVRVYVGPNPYVTGSGAAGAFSASGDQAFEDTYDAIASENAASVVTTSFPRGEPAVSAASRDAENLIFMRMALQGQSMFSATQDQGAFVHVPDPDTGGGEVHNVPGVADPASSPFVTGVGGTRLETSPVLTETGWAMGGGGVSGYWPIPHYQQTIPNPDPLTSFGGGANESPRSLTMRNVPDVSLNFGGNFWYLTYGKSSTDPPEVAPDFRAVGGTSMTAPLWAAFTALVNQARAANGLGRIGFLNPILYKLGADQYNQVGGPYFNDVTTGCQSVPPGETTMLFYCAKPGYDDVTGWGSFTPSLLAYLSGTTLMQAPPSLSGTGTGPLSIDWSWTEVGYATGYGLKTEAGGDVSGALVSGSTSFIETGLSPNTAYSRKVVASNAAGSSASTVVSAFTFAAEPASLSPTSVGAGAITVNWGPNGNPEGTQYYAEMAGGSGFVNTGWITATSTTFDGLTPNTPYHFRVKAQNSSGVQTVPIDLPTAVTLANAPASLSPSGITPQSITAHWGANGNPVGTEYYAEMAGDSGFGSILADSGWTNAAGASFSGLIPNTLYHWRVKARNYALFETSAAGLPSALTLAAPPAALDVLAAADSSITAHWSANGNPAGTRYTLEASTDDFQSVSGSVGTFLTTIAVSGLQPNTRHSLRVKAENANGIPTAYLYTATGQTLAAAPTNLSLSLVSNTDLIASWSLAGNPADTAFELSLSSDNFTAFFSTPLAFSALSAPTTLIRGLTTGTTYYVRIRAEDSNGTPTAFFATSLFLPDLFQTVTPGSGASLSFSHATLLIPPQTFPQAVTMTLRNPVLPGTNAGISGPLIPTGAGIQIDAGGLQPLKPLTLTLDYSSGANITDPTRLVIALYNPAIALWVPLPSVPDPPAHHITASIRHLSLYQVMQQQIPAASLASAAVSVFPNPVHPSRGEAMNFLGLPGRASLTIYTFAGIKVRSLTADANGMTSWNARNDAGNSVASGVYLVLIKAGGDTKTMKVMVER